MQIACERRRKFASVSSLRSTAAQCESEYFDEVVQQDGDFDPFLKKGWQTLARCFKKMVPLAGPLELLDVGCGTGQSYQIYADRVGSFTGLDLSQCALDKAAARFPQCRWVLGDACALPFAEAQFDAVAFSAVLHHIEEYQQALCEGLRVLKPGGYAFAFDPNLLHPAMALFRHPRSWLYSPQGVSPNERPLLPTQLRAVFRQSGFANVRQRCQAGIPYRRAAPKLLHALLGLYNVGDWCMDLSGLGRWFGAMAITVGQKPQGPGKVQE